MKKYVLIMITVLCVASCTNLEFVYKDIFLISKLKNNTDLIISGDESDEIYSYINRILGSKNSNDPNYKLSISSKRIDKAQVIEKDATASKFSIEYNIIYNLYDMNKNCEIKEIKIITKDSYDSKSAGYSFGTDLSKKEVGINILSNNVDQFVSYVGRNFELNSCNGEN